MVEVNDKITVVRDNGIVEGQPADATPVAEGAPLPEAWTSRRTFIGYFDMKAEGVFGRHVTLIKNLRHDFLAKVQLCSLNPGLVRDDQEAHKLRASGRLSLRFSKFGDFVQLPMRGLLVNGLKDGSGNS